jgi:hypothetical protein
VVEAVATVKLVNGCVILYHCTDGCPAMTPPKLNVPLLAGDRIPVPTPESVM